VVVVNDDKFLMDKKGYCFLPLEDRMKIVESVGRCINETGVIVTSVSGDNMIEALDLLKPKYFMNGGDRSSDNIPEKEVCDKNDIKIVDGV
jgi:D-beta-D-heptose 7-phosphate kinase/D-beta-D-heptose 1-phosphate adenosyltransferase